MPSRRLLRVQELLKRQIGETIRREIPVEQSGLITVHEVLVTSDLRQAKVFVGIMGSPERQRSGLALLEQNRARIQTLVTESVLLKFTPRLRFVVDDAVSRGDRVLEILDELEDSPPPS